LETAGNEGRSEVRKEDADVSWGKRERSKQIPTTRSYVSSSAKRGKEDRGTKSPREKEERQNGDPRNPQAGERSEKERY